MVLAKTRGNYPAVLKALEVVTHGVSQPVAGSVSEPFAEVFPPA
jgi:hypothetical protein